VASLSPSQINTTWTLFLNCCAYSCKSGNCTGVTARSPDKENRIGQTGRAVQPVMLPIDRFKRMLDTLPELWPSSYSQIGFAVEHLMSEPSVNSEHCHVEKSNQTCQSCMRNNPNLAIQWRPSSPAQARATIHISAKPTA
jgi:hypothetical protein